MKVNQIIRWKLVINKITNISRQYITWLRKIVTKKNNMVKKIHECSMKLNVIISYLD